jgi:hypothetical protein
LKIEDYTESKALEKIFKFPPPPSFATRQVHDGTVLIPELNVIFFVEIHVPNKGYSADAMPWIWRINLTDFSNPVTEKSTHTPNSQSQTAQTTTTATCIGRKKETTLIWEALSRCTQGI